MMNGVHPVLMLCQARAPFPWPVDSHPRVEKKYSWWSAWLREVRSRRIQIRKTIRASRKSYPSSCISTPWSRRWETSPLLTIGSGLDLKSVLIVWLRSPINPGYQQVQKEPLEGQECTSEGERKHATGHCLDSTREDEVMFSPLKGTELGEEEWGELELWLHCNMGYVCEIIDFLTLSQSELGLMILEAEIVLSTLFSTE